MLSVGRLRPPFADDVDHYRKLIARHVKLDLVEVRDDEDVERRIPDRAYVVLLHREGEPLDSIGLSRWLEERRMAGLDLCFVLGGPAGIDVPCQHRLSLGAITLPHQLAKVVLLEQLVRAHKILAGEPYHL